MNGNIPIDKKNLKRLKKYKKDMRTLKNYNDQKKPIRTKRKILIQRGGFLQFVIPALLSSAIGALINKVIE